MYMGSDWAKHYTTATKLKDPTHCATAHYIPVVMLLDTKRYARKEKKQTHTHTADCSQHRRPATIMFILYCKIFLLCSTWGKAMGRTVFTAPVWYNPTINLTQCHSGFSCCSDRENTQKFTCYIQTPRGGFSRWGVLLCPAVKLVGLIQQQDRLHQTACKHIQAASGAI